MSQIPQMTASVSKTKPQSRLGGGQSTSVDDLLTYLLAKQTTIPTGTIRTYNVMRANPTLTLARIVFNAPIQAAGWAVKAQDDAPDDIIAFAKDVINDLRKPWVKYCLEAIEYGFKPMELIWGVKDLRWVPVRIKPLAVDKTEVVLDEGGDLVGLKNQGVELRRPYFAWCAHDVQDDNWYGRSRYENVRTTAWWGWTTAFKQHQRYLSLAACPIPIIQYPPGSGETETGQNTSNFLIAKMIAAKLQTGQPVVMPNTLAKAALDLLDRGVPVEKLKSWIFEWLEASGLHGNEFIEAMRYYDTGMLRGYFVPERATVEGQYGTKADATVHANQAMLNAGETLSAFALLFNEQVLQPCVLFNFGPQYVKAVWAEAEALVDDQYDLIEKIITGLLVGNAQLADTWLDVDAMLDKLNLPKSATVVIPQRTPGGIVPDDSVV